MGTGIQKNARGKTKNTVETERHEGKQGKKEGGKQVELEEGKGWRGKKKQLYGKINLVS